MFLKTHTTRRTPQSHHQSDSAAREIVHGREDTPNQIVSTPPAPPRPGLGRTQKALDAPLFALMIHRFHHSIRVCDDQIARLQPNAAFLIVRIGKQSNSGSPSLEPLDRAVIAKHNRRIMPRVDVPQRPRSPVEQAIEQRRKPLRGRGMIGLAVHDLE